MMLVLIWVVAFLWALFLYYRAAFSHFKKRGVLSEKAVPLFGSMMKATLRMEHLVDNFNRTYRNFPDQRFVGRFEFMKPLVLIRDLELIRKVTVKDFEHFLDHRDLGNSSTADPLFFRNLIFLKGQEWKDMRSTLSPAFTSSKIRLMVPFMVDVGNQMVLNLKKSIKESGSEYLDVDIKDLTTRYANDVIASCAFGLKVDSHSDKNNEFYTQGLKASTVKFKQIMLFFVSLMVPWLAKRMKLSMLEEDSQNFFRNLVLSNMQEREKLNIFRPDMIHLLMEAKKGKLSREEKIQDADDAGFATVQESEIGRKQTIREWTDDDLIAQAVIFFIAGFETVSTAMSFLLHELAVNPHVQEKLVEEIRQTDAKNQGKFDFTTIQQMTYMDMVVSELLRMWPPASAIDRLCIKDYNLGKPNDTATEDYIMREGEGIQVPVWSIHHDPQYFPDPEKFDPERFSEENKRNIKPFTYNPFGLGPRNCIGSRFALCEVKIMAFQLLRHMEVTPGPRTTIPAKLDTSTFNVRMKGGHWLRLRVRD
ncbi:hypothetical protein O0L34_g18014 [Tuta absoluta]|nr:hypothetical protein O0L34_g18014 [Tuta absoluta]